MKRSYGLLRASGVLLTVICGAIWILSILFALSNGLAGIENEWTGNWIKLLVGIGLGQAFVAISDSAERISKLDRSMKGDALHGDRTAVRKSIRTHYGEEQIS